MPLILTLVRGAASAATTARCTWAGECGRPTNNIVRKVNSKFAGIRNAQIACNDYVKTQTED
jgi:hypothetical protein